MGGAAARKSTKKKNQQGRRRWHDGDAARVEAPYAEHAGGPRAANDGNAVESRCRPHGGDVNRDSSSCRVGSLLAVAALTLST